MGGFRERIQLERANRTFLQRSVANHRFCFSLWGLDFWQTDSLEGFGYGIVVDGIRPFSRLSDNAAQRVD